MLIKDNQVFIGFAYFYQYFIQDFSIIAILFILILKTIKKFVNLILKVFKADSNEIVLNNNKINKIIQNLSKSKKLKNKKFQNLTYVKAIMKSIFLIFNNRKVFNYL